MSRQDLTMDDVEKAYQRGHEAGQESLRGMALHLFLMHKHEELESYLRGAIPVVEIIWSNKPGA